MNEIQLYIVSTPIGNLGDITLRALDTLKEVDFVLCEDTRVSKKLFDHYNISKTLISYHQHSDEKKIGEIKKLLSDGKKLALITDAGTPGISDPGNKLIEELLTTNPDLGITIIPGASAVTAALALSGFPTDKFIFLGFPPHKNKRNKYFKELAEYKYTVCLYESSHRITKTLNELIEVLGSKRRVVVCRELTKKFETIYRGTAGGMTNMSIKEKGEFVIVINNK